MDADSIRRTFDAEGPFVSIYLSTPSDTEDAATQFELKWRNALRELEEQGIDEATREAISAARGRHDLGQTRVVIASPGKVQLATSLPDPPPTDSVTVAPLPRVLPLLDSNSTHVPHVAVIIDRTGADVLGYTDKPGPVVTDTVEGPDQAHVHRANVGGWSQQRYQRGTEQEWQHNAKEVADEVTRLASELGAELLVVAGDVRAVQLFGEVLPQHLHDKLHEVQGSRGEDGGDELVTARVADAVAEAVHARTAAMLAKFAEERGQNDLAVEGIAATIEALRKAQVGTLILTDEVHQDGTIYVGSDAFTIATSRDEVEALGAEPREVPLGDALAWAALSTGAEVRFASGEHERAPREGVGALLRYSDASTALDG
jgi:hemin uptake protein HemP